MGSWRIDRIEHPVLPLCLALDGDDALVYVGLGARLSDLIAFVRRHGATATIETRRSTEAKRQLTEYLAGARTTFALPLRPLGTPFQLRAWSALQTIPYGGTLSYGEQAAQLGSAKLTRAVGRANGSNPLPIVIPCHRVIGRDGDLVGFGGGLSAKAWLLELEAKVLGPFSPAPSIANTRQLGLFS